MRTFKLLTLILAVFCFAALVIRIHYGIDLSDEPFYLAMAYRFVLGDKPYHDEYMLAQGVALIDYFFTKIFIFIKGNTEGIVLYFRYLFILFSSLITAFLAWTFTEALSFPAALLASLTFLSIVPFALPTLGYNSVGIYFVTASLLLALQNLVFNKSKYFIFAAGLMMGIGVIGHPAHLGTLAGFLSLLFLFSDKKVEKIIFFISGLIIPVIFFKFFFDVQLKDLAAAAANTSTMYKSFERGLSFNKAFGIFKDLLSFHPWPIYLLVFGYTLISIKSKSAYFKESIAFLLAPVVFLMFHRNGGLHSMISAYGLCAPLFLYNSNYQHRIQMILWFWLPCVIAGFFISMLSYNQSYNAAVGLWPACALTTFAIFKWLDKPENKFNLSFLTLGAMPVCLYTFFLFRTFYMEDPLSKLTVKIPSGPFAGMITTERKAGFLTAFEADMKNLENTPGRILIYPHFPGGYLFTNRAPAARAIWGCLAGDFELCREYYKKHEKETSVAIRIEELYRAESKSYSGALDSELDTLVKQSLKPSKENRYYTLFSK